MDRYITLGCVALHYVTLRHVMLRYVLLYCIVLQTIHGRIHQVQAHVSGFKSLLVSFFSSFYCVTMKCRRPNKTFSQTYDRFWTSLETRDEIETRSAQVRRNGNYKSNRQVKVVRFHSLFSYRTFTFCVVPTPRAVGLTLPDGGSSELEAGIALQPELVWKRGWISMSWAIPGNRKGVAVNSCR